MPINFKSLFLCTIGLYLAIAPVQAQNLPPSTCAKYHTIQELKDNFAELLRHFEYQNDRRKLFVRVYQKVTASIEGLIQSRKVVNKVWMEDLVVGFGNEYRRALVNYEAGHLEQVPSPWLLDFDMAKTRRIGLQTQLLLSMSSHILYDLPRTVGRSSRDLKAYQADYFRLNSMFNDIMMDLLDLVYGESNFSILYAYHPVERMKRDVIAALVALMRNYAWKKSIDMAALDSSQQEIFSKSLEGFSRKFNQALLAFDPFLSAAPGSILPGQFNALTINQLEGIFRMLESIPPSLRNEVTGLTQ